MDEIDGRCFIENYAGRSLKNAAANLTQNYFEKPLRHLEAEAEPTAVDKFIKQRFWNTVLASGIMPKKHPISGLHEDICTYTHLWANVLNNPAKLAWILRLEFDQKTQIEIINDRIFRQIHRFLDNPKRNRQGEVSASYFKNLIRFMELMFKYKNPS
jgi:hypothetical protein